MSPSSPMIGTRTALGQQRCRFPWRTGVTRDGSPAAMKVISDGSGRFGSASRLRCTASAVMLPSESPETTVCPPSFLIASLVKADADGYRFVGERCIRSEQRTRGPWIEDQMHADRRDTCSSWRRPCGFRGPLVAQGSIRLEDPRRPGIRVSHLAGMYAWSATGGGAQPLRQVRCRCSPWPPARPSGAIPVSKRWAADIGPESQGHQQSEVRVCDFLDNRC